MSLEQLLTIKVTTPSKRAETPVEAPGVFSVITADEIAGFGANSLFDVLERAPSVQTLGSSLFPRNLAVMRGDLRSLFDDHVLILFDGRPIRESINGGVDSPFFTAFPVEMIERIEIVRGPGSVLYGTNAFVGSEQPVLLYGVSARLRQHAAAFTRPSRLRKRCHQALGATSGGRPRGTDPSERAVVSRA
jgi:outer membrane receptor protein involved in Fe transport